MAWMAWMAWIQVGGYLDLTYIPSPEQPTSGGMGRLGWVLAQSSMYSRDTWVGSCLVMLVMLEQPVTRDGQRVEPMGWIIAGAVEVQWRCSTYRIMAGWLELLTNSLSLRLSQCHVTRRPVCV